MEHIWLLVIATALLLPGIAGVLLPMLPGIPYMWLVALGFGVVDRFVHLTGRDLGILAIIALLSFAVDYFAGVLGAKYGGAAARSMASGLIGLVIGVILLPPFGGLIGLFIGIMASELQMRRSRSQAVRAATSGLIGSVMGIGINFLLALIFVIAFIALAWR